jgi:nicotinate-nucleotide pyrophosphorylase (carboxylating)
MVSLDLDKVREIVRTALDEDIGSGDVTTRMTIAEEIIAEAVILAQESGVVAGIPVVELTFQAISGEVQVKRRRQDGQRVDGDDVILQLRGPARAILTAERVALNFLQRLSGIATQTARFVQAVEGTGAKILDTRKTTPGLRFLEKYAVRVGGGHNHRMGLYDMVLIKDNHIRAGGGIPRVVQRVRKQGVRLPLEVEASDLEQVAQALEADVDRIMLDNMSPSQIKKAVSLVQSRKGQRRRPELEVSGKIHLGNIRQVAIGGVDFISIGALTHSAPALDMNLVIATLDSPGRQEKR